MTLAASRLDVFVYVFLAVVICEFVSRFDTFLCIKTDAFCSFVNFRLAVWFACVVEVASEIIATGAVDRPL